jgi:hypothetical protein
VIRVSIARASRNLVSRRGLKRMRIGSNQLPVIRGVAQSMVTVKPLV